ncbi:transglycosylase SLT domain-containing protein [Candidatus Woesearchaeota archaeon]|nr:transglycosylase SLT domain-containing protein [Candidatus Woesearchaeota archaeon]
MATSVYYNNSITANAVKEVSLDSETGISIIEVDEIGELVFLNEGWYQIRNGFVFYLDTFNSYVPLYIKVKNPEQQNGLLAVDAEGNIEFGIVVNLLREKEIVDEEIIEEPIQITGEVTGFEGVSAFATKPTGTRQVTTYIYPPKYQDKIAATEQKYGLPKNLLKAVINVESKFNPDAVGPDVKDKKTGKIVNAKGLGQLMPETQSDYGVKNPFDPYQNIDGAGARLRTALKNANGDVALGLSIYNSGEGTVQKAGDIPTNPQTQSFVTQVLFSQGAYNSLTNVPKPFVVTYNQPEIITTGMLQNGVSFTNIKADGISQQGVQLAGFNFGNFYDSVVLKFTVAQKLPSTVKDSKVDIKIEGEQIANFGANRAILDKETGEVVTIDAKNLVVSRASYTQDEINNLKNRFNGDESKDFKAGDIVVYNGALYEFVQADFGTGVGTYTLNPPGKPDQKQKVSILDLNFRGRPAFSSIESFASSRVARLGEIYSVGEDGKVRDAQNSVIAQLNGNFEELKNKKIQKSLEVTDTEQGPRGAYSSKVNYKIDIVNDLAQAEAKADEVLRNEFGDIISIGGKPATLKDVTYVVPEILSEDSITFNLGAIYEADGKYYLDIPGLDKPVGVEIARPKVGKEYFRWEDPRNGQLYRLIDGKLEVYNGEWFWSGFDPRSTQIIAEVDKLERKGYEENLFAARDALDAEQATPAQSVTAPETAAPSAPVVPATRGVAAPDAQSSITTRPAVPTKPKGQTLQELKDNGATEDQLRLMRTMLKDGDIAGFVKKPGEEGRGYIIVRTLREDGQLSNTVHIYDSDAVGIATGWYDGVIDVHSKHYKEGDIKSILRQAGNVPDALRETVASPELRDPALVETIQGLSTRISVVGIDGSNGEIVQHLGNYYLRLKKDDKTIVYPVTLRDGDFYDEQGMQFTTQAPTPTTATRAQVVSTNLEGGSLVASQYGVLRKEGNEWVNIQTQARFTDEWIANGLNANLLAVIPTYNNIEQASELDIGNYKVDKNTGLISKDNKPVAVLAISKEELQKLQSDRLIVDIDFLEGRLAFVEGAPVAVAQAIPPPPVAPAPPPAEPARVFTNKGPFPVIPYYAGCGFKTGLAYTKCKSEEQSINYLHKEESLTLAKITVDEGNPWYKSEPRFIFKINERTGEAEWYEVPPAVLGFSSRIKIEGDIGTYIKDKYPDKTIKLTVKDEEGKPTDLTLSPEYLKEFERQNDGKSLVTYLAARDTYVESNILLVPIVAVAPEAARTPTAPAVSPPPAAKTPAEDARDNVLNDLKAKGATPAQIDSLRLHMTEGEQAEITSDGNIIRTIISSKGEQTGALSVYNKKGENIAFVAPEGDIFENPEATNKEEIRRILSKATAIVPEQIRRALAEQPAPAPPAAKAEDAEAPRESVAPAPSTTYTIGTKLQDAGGYWEKEKEGWRRYRPDGTEQGSWYGGEEPPLLNNFDGSYWLKEEKGWKLFNKDGTEAGRLWDKDEQPPITEKKPESALDRLWAWASSLFGGEQKPAEPEPTPKEEPRATPAEPSPTAPSLNERRIESARQIKELEERYENEIRRGADRNDLIPLEIEIGRLKNTAPPNEDFLKLLEASGTDRNEVARSFRYKSADQLTVQDIKDWLYFENQIIPRLKSIGYEVREEENKELKIYRIGAEKSVSDFAVPGLFEIAPPVQKGTTTSAPDVIPAPSSVVSPATISAPVPPEGTAAVVNYYHDEKTGQVYAITLGKDSDPDFYYQFNPSTRTWEVLDTTSGEIDKITNPANDNVRIKSLNEVQTIIQTQKAPAVSEPTSVPAPASPSPSIREPSGERIPEIDEEDIEVAGLSDEESRRFAREQGLTAQADGGGIIFRCPGGTRGPRCPSLPSTPITPQKPKEEAIPLYTAGDTFNFYLGPNGEVIGARTQEVFKDYKYDPSRKKLIIGNNELDVVEGQAALTKVNVPGGSFTLNLDTKIAKKETQGNLEIITTNLGDIIIIDEKSGLAFGYDVKTKKWVTLSVLSDGSTKKEEGLKATLASHTQAAERAQEIIRETAAALSTIGYLYNLNQNKEALALVKEELRKNPNDENLLRYGVELSDREKDYTSLKSYAERLVVLKPNDNTALNALAWAEFKNAKTLDDLKRAEGYAIKSINIQRTPNNVHTLASINEKQGKTDDAERLFLEAYVKDSKDPQKLVDYYRTSKEADESGIEVSRVKDANGNIVTTYADKSKIVLKPNGDVDIITPEGSIISAKKEAKPAPVSAPISVPEQQAAPPVPPVTQPLQPGPKFVDVNGKLVLAIPPSDNMKPGHELAHEETGLRGPAIIKQADGSWKGEDGKTYVWDTKIGWTRPIPENFALTGKVIPLNDQKLRQALDLLGYSYIEDTREAVELFQRKNKLKIDGKPGDETLGKMNQLLGEQRIVLQQKENAQGFTPLTLAELQSHGTGIYRIDKDGYIYQTIVDYTTTEFIVGVASQEVINQLYGYNAFKIDFDGKIIKVGSRFFTPTATAPASQDAIKALQAAYEQRLISIDENPVKDVVGLGQGLVEGDYSVVNLQGNTYVFSKELKDAFNLPLPMLKIDAQSLNILEGATFKVTKEGDIIFDAGGQIRQVNSRPKQDFYQNTQLLENKEVVATIISKDGQTAKLVFKDGTTKDAIAVEDLNGVAYFDKDFKNLLLSETYPDFFGQTPTPSGPEPSRPGLLPAATPAPPPAIPSFLPSLPEMQGETIDPSKIKINPAVIPGGPKVPPAGEPKGQLPPSVTGQRPIHHNFVQLPDKTVYSTKVYQSDNPDFVYVQQFKVEGASEKGQQQFLLHKSMVDKINFAQWIGDPKAIPLTDGGIRRGAICADNKCSFIDDIQVKGKPNQEIKTDITLGEGGKELTKNVIDTTFDPKGVIKKEIFFDSVSKVTSTIITANNKQTITFEKNGKKVDVAPDVYQAIKSNAKDDNVISYFFGEAANQGFTKLDKESFKSLEGGLGYVGDLKGRHVILLDANKVAAKQGDTLLGFIDRQKGLSATIEGPATIDPVTKEYKLNPGGTAFVEEKAFDGSLTSKRVEQQSKDTFAKVEYLKGKEVTYFGATALVNGNEYTITPISDRNDPFYGYLKLEPQSGGESLYMSTGEPNIWNPFGGGNIYKKGADDKLQRVDDKEAVSIRNALDKERENRGLPTFAQVSSQRFFVNVERVLTDFQGFGYYATLFFDEDSLLKWRNNVDRLFATLYLGTEYWSSTICGEYLDGEDDGIAYAETPQGLSQVAAHIEATRTEPILTPTGQEFIYKITFNVRNGDYDKDPNAPEEMNVNVVLRGERTVAIFKQDQTVKRGSSFGRIGRNAIAQDSTAFYNEICLTFDKTPLRWKTSNGEICNTIVESSGAPSTVATSTTATASSGGGAAEGDVNDF